MLCVFTPVLILNEATLLALDNASVVWLALVTSVDLLVGVAHDRACVVGLALVAGVDLAVNLPHCD